MNAKLIHPHTPGCTARQHHPENPWAHPSGQTEWRDQKGRRAPVWRKGEFWLILRCKNAFCGGRLAVRAAWIGEQAEREVSCSGK